MDPQKQILDWEQKPFEFYGTESEMIEVLDRCIHALPGTRKIDFHLAPAEKPIHIRQTAAWLEEYKQDLFYEETKEVKRTEYIRAVWIGTGEKAYLNQSAQSSLLSINYCHMAISYPLPMPNFLLDEKAAFLHTSVGLAVKVLAQTGRNIHGLIECVPLTNRLLAAVIGSIQQWNQKAQEDIKPLVQNKPLFVELTPGKPGIHIVHLENTSVERFAARFEEYPSAAYYPQSLTGRHRTYFRERTRQEKVELTGGVMYLYYDIDSGALVVKIEAKHFRNDILNIIFTWHVEAEQFAREFITDLWVSWKAPFPNWMKTEELKQREAQEAADKNKHQEQQLNSDNAGNSIKAEEIVHEVMLSTVESLPNTVAKAEQVSEISAREDLINHLEQGLSRGEAKAKMSLSDDGLKSRQQRLRKFWNMSPGATWADLLAEAAKRRGARDL